MPVTFEALARTADKTSASNTRMVMGKREKNTIGATTSSGANRMEMRKRLAM